MERVALLLREMQQLLGSNCYWDTRLVCRDGVVGLNRLVAALTVDLLYPGLLLQTWWQHQEGEEVSVLLPDVGVAEVQQLLKQIFTPTGIDKGDVEDSLEPIILGSSLQTVEQEEVKIIIVEDHQTLAEAYPRGVTSPRVTATTATATATATTTATATATATTTTATATATATTTVTASATIVTAPNPDLRPAVTEVLTVLTPESDAEAVARGPLLHRCPHCPFTCKIAGNLKQHRASKHGAIRYRCSLCRFLTTTLRNLTNHQLAAHRQPQFSCTACSYRAATGGKLKAHQLTKHEGALFRCHLCDYVAGARFSVQRHCRRVHGGETFPCSSCDYSATTRQHLKVHQESVHEGVRFNCDQCQFRTTTRGHLAAHVKSRHKNNGGLS